MAPTVQGNGPVFQEAFATGNLADVPMDTVPLTKEFVPEYPGATPEAPYGYTPTGRIRKSPPRTPGTSTPRGVGNTKLAEEAATVLTNLNRAVGIGFAVCGLFDTAKQWTEGQSTFYEQAVQSLENDPALCRQILKGGQTGGKLGLLIAYGMVVAPTGAVAMNELKVKRAAAKAAKVEAELEQHHA